jgi:hypothetical protein
LSSFAPTSKNVGESRGVLEGSKMGFGIADVIGFLAAAWMLLTFCQRAMVQMRLSAIAANICFIAYGALAHVYPVLLLHAVLIPVNVKGLFDSLSARESSEPRRTDV